VLRGYTEAEVAQHALAWPRNEDQVRRLITAKALKRPLQQGTPCADTIEAIRLLAADTEREVVLAVLDSFGALTHFGPYQPHQIAPVLQGMIAHMADDKTGLAEVGAALVADGDGWTRNCAIEGLIELGDPRVVDAIVTELDRDESEKHARLETLMRLNFLMPAIINHPDRRYLPGLQRWLSRYRHEDGFKAAIKACTIKP